MKLQHHLTCFVLAFTSALSAANIPQIKAPKTPTAPKVVKVPVAVKVPVVPKVPTAPKIPTLARVPSAPKVPVVKVPVVAKVPAAPKAVTAPKVPVVAKVPAVTVKAGSAINTGRLNNLKQTLQIDQSKIVAAGGKGGRFINDNFGNSAATKKPGSLMDGVRQGASGGRDRNPLSGNPLDGLRGDRNGQVSDDASKPSRSQNFTTTVKNKDGSETTHYSDGSSMRSYENGTVIYTSEKGKTTYMPGSIAAPFVPTRPMINGSTEPPKRSTVNGSTGSGAKTPLPDDAGSSGTTVVTRNDLRGLNAKKNGTSEPSQDESGTGGPVNTGANGTGKAGSLSQPAGDFLEGAAPNLDSALENIRVKIESKINTGGR